MRDTTEQIARRFETSERRIGSLLIDTAHHALVDAAGGNLQIEVIVRCPETGFRYWHKKYGVSRIE